MYVYVYLNGGLWVRYYAVFNDFYYVIVFLFHCPSDCCNDHKRTFRRPGRCRSQSGCWQWDFSLCSRWVWNLVLWIPSTSPLQRPLRFDLSSAGLSAVFAVRNSCPVHLNSSDSVWVFVSVCEIVVSECLDALMQVYVQAYTNIYQLCSVCNNRWVVNSAAILSTVYKCAISGTVCCMSKGISSCLFPAHEYILLFTYSISLLTHIFPSFSYTLAWAHKPTTYSSQLGAVQ